MTGISDFVSSKVSSPSDIFTAPITQGLKAPKAIVNTAKQDTNVASGKAQKTQQLQTSTNDNASAEAANTAQIASDAAAAEAKRQAGLMPTADDAAMKANKRRAAAAQASAGGRDSTILTGQRLGD